MMDAIYALISWLAELIKSVWQAFVDFLSDIWIDVADIVLQAIAGLIVSIPVPSFLSNYSIGQIIGYMPSDVLYFVGLMHMGEGFALISGAVAFRMVRKVITVFQW